MDEPEQETTDEVGPPPDAHRAHSQAVWALITVATLVLTLSAFNTWLERQLLDTDNWVDTSTALLDNDDLRRELATYLVNELYASVDVGEALEARLPDDLAGLAGAAAAVLRDPLIDAVDVVLKSGPVRDLWRDANRTVHSTAVAILEDDVGPNISTADGKVTIDLGRLVRTVGMELGVPSGVLDSIPEGAGQVTVVESDTLEAAQTAVQVIKVLSVLLFVLVLALYGVAIYLASNWRREATRNVGSAIAFSGIVLLVLVQFATRLVVDSAATSSGRIVSQAVLPIATELLRRTAWGILFIGLLIWLFAILAGPSKRVAPIQRAAAAGFRRQAAAMWAGIAVLFLLVLAWGPISVANDWWTLLFVVVVIIAGVEALRRASLARAVEEQSAPEEGKGGEEDEEAGLLTTGGA